MARDFAPVVAAETLLRHGLSDDKVLAFVAETWNLDDTDARDAIAAAHVLLRREHEIDNAHDGTSG